MEENTPTPTTATATATTTTIMCPLSLYSCTGFRSVRSDSIHDAAEIFALRAARREFGRSGQVGTLQAESWTVGYSNVEFSSFVGYGRHELSGHNVRFTVHLMGGSL